ncbi:Uncharacterized 12.7 kDa protein in lys 3'region [Vibrio coralliirubri]|nr:Uncharacterized 12.7 kDa protein in lys 3'region [Vibrio coralliirubri]
MPDSDLLETKNYIDIKVVDGGWDMDAGQQPAECSDLYSIAQDIKHAIMESGLARLLVAERNPALRADVMVQIEQIAELDVRVVPGTATASELDAGDITLTAIAYQYGGLELSVGAIEV